MNWSKFTKQEKYVYYSPLFNEIVLAAEKHKIAHIYIEKVHICVLYYIGEL